jgi:glycosyltransferase involved in cell wall biosynthesis
LTPPQTEAFLAAGHPLSADVGAPIVSVVIPALNAEQHIALCLASLTTQNCPTSTFEVIVVDNGSTDATVSIASSFKSTLNIRVLEKKMGYVSEVRNYGVKNARGRILAFLDSDCVAPPNWLSDATRLLQDTGAGIVGSHYRIPPQSSWSALVWDRYLFADKSGRIAFVPTGNLLISRSLFDSLGGLDETIQTNEDVELCRRVRSLGFSVHAYPQIAVVHFGTPQTLRAFYKKERWHGLHVLRVFLRDFPDSGNGRVITYALYILVCELVAMVGLLLAFSTGNWWTFSLALVGALIPAIALSMSNVHRARRWKDFFSLFVLYLTYGFARARCLLDPRSWTPSQQA